MIFTTFSLLCRNAGSAARAVCVFAFATFESLICRHWPF